MYNRSGGGLGPRCELVQDPCLLPNPRRSLGRRNTDEGKGPVGELCPVGQRCCPRIYGQHSQGTCAVEVRPAGFPKAWSMVMQVHNMGVGVSNVSFIQDHKTRESVWGRRLYWCVSSSKTPQRTLGNGRQIRAQLVKIFEIRYLCLKSGDGLVDFNYPTGSPTRIT